MKRMAALSLVLILCTVFCGCARNFELQTELPDTAILDKSPLRVALYIPDSTRNYTEATPLPSRCGFAARGLAPNKYGAVFAETVQGTLGQVFKEVTPISRPVEEGYDFIIQAEFTELAYKLGCRPDPVGYFILKGSLRALDAKGNEVWRSNMASNKVESPIEMRYNYEKVIPSAIATMVGSWTQGLLAAPQIQQLSNSRAIKK
jgi:hypothetical protein